MSSFVDHEPRNTQEVLLLIAFDRDQTRRFLNGVIREKNVIANYGNGKFLGYTNEVVVLEGDWPAKLTMGALKFDNYAKAKMWFNSDSVFKQQDCLDNIEMFLIPLRESVDYAAYPVLTIANMDEQAKNCCCHDKESEIIRQHGGIPFVACTSHVVRWRGRSVTSLMCVSCWPSVEAVQAWYYSNEQKAICESRQMLTAVDMFMVELNRRV